METYKLIKVKRLQKDCEAGKKFVLLNKPKNEKKLIGLMKHFFSGFMLKQRADGRFHAIGEICEVADNANKVKFGRISFIVPSCKIAFTRDKEGYILNIKQFD